MLQPCVSYVFFTSSIIQAKVITVHVECLTSEKTHHIVLVFLFAVGVAF